MRLLLTLCVLAFFAVPSPVQTEPALAADEFGARQAVLETPWFTFYSHFGFNLYDAVLMSATARRNKSADPVHAGDCFGSLVQEERSAWDAAVSYYAETVAATGDFSRERDIVRAHLAGVEISLDDDDRRDLHLSLLFLRAAAPAWRACRWAEQDAANRRWIAEIAPRLERHADNIGARLEKLFAGTWRHRPIAVDLVAEAGWAGADTSRLGGRVTHIQISSRNPAYQGPASLEIIFHEASHELVAPRSGPIAELIASAARETGVAIHPSLWHGLLFVTAGDVVREVLAQAGEGPYQPFADEVFGGEWEVLHQPLVEHWLPYVRGTAGREEAARNLMKALGAAMGSPSAREDASVELDHVFVLVSPNAPEARVLEEAGLKLDPRIIRHTGQGTASKFIWFQNMYLELAWIDDAKVARDVSQAGLGTDLVARSEWKHSGASPFGVGLHFKPGRSLPPFPTRDYSAEWMPAGTAIKIAASAAQMHEPLIFIVPAAFQVKPMDQLAPEEKKRLLYRSTHSLSMQQLTEVKLTVARDTSPSETMKALRSMGILSVQVGDAPLLELTFDRGARGKTLDVRPTLPVLIHY